MGVVRKNSIREKSWTELRKAAETDRAARRCKEDQRLGASAAYYPAAWPSPVPRSSSALSFASPATSCDSLRPRGATNRRTSRSEEHTSELQSRPHLVCRLLLEKKKTTGQTLIICQGNRGATVP